MCHALREAARRLSRHYADVLRPVALSPGQFSLLASLSGAQPVPQHRVAEALGLDRTTLSRDIRPLERRGLVVATPAGKDRRVRLLTLTPAGRDLLGQAIPLWEAAQQASAERLDAAAWPALRSSLQMLSH